MANIDLPTQRIESDEGSVISYKTDTDTDEPITTTDSFFIRNSGHERLLIKKGAGTVDVTITTPLTVNGLAVADRVVAVAASKDVVIGPFSPNIYNDSDGKVKVDFSVAAAIEVAVLQV